MATPPADSTVRSRGAQPQAGALGGALTLAPAQGGVSGWTGWQLALAH